VRIPIFTDEAEQQGGWHGKVLAQAFAEKGVESVFVPLQDCVIHVADGNARIQIPGFEENPAGGFVRGIAGGTLQQVITRLNILHILALQGVKIYNNGRAIERTVDKGMTSFLLAQAGVSTPKTWVCESRHHAHAIMQTELTLAKMVMKPLFGSQGKGLRLLNADTQLPVPMDAFVDGVFYLQEFIDAGEANYDYRVMVVNNEPVAAMRRIGQGWLNNVAQGARCEEIHDADVLTLAVKAAKAIDIDYCGVDIMRDRHGQLWVIEVNSIPAWYGLQFSVKVNINQIFVNDFLSKL
jgi:tetrahydromethanopterin:alpha-L-glutamate ligase